MGIDLRLLPLDCDSDVIRFSHTILSCDRNYGLWDAVRACPSTPAVPFSSFVGARVPDGAMEGEPTYGVITVDAYGQPYRFVTARWLADAFGRIDQRPPGLSERNTAVAAYLSALPPETRVALDWH